MCRGWMRAIVLIKTTAIILMRTAVTATTIITAITTTPPIITITSSTPYSMSMPITNKPQPQQQRQQ